MSKYFLSLSLVSTLILSASAYARTSTLNCSGVSNSNSVQVTIIKSWDGSNLTYSGTINLNGQIDGQSGSLNGQANFSADPRVNGPNNTYYSVADKNGNSISSHTIESFVKSTDQSPVPGYVLSAKLTTTNASLPFVVLKGVLGNSQKTMNANISLSNGKQSESIDNADLACSYVVAD